MKTVSRFAIVSVVLAGWAMPAAAEITINPYPNGAPAALPQQLIEEPAEQPAPQPLLNEQDLMQPEIYTQETSQAIDMSAGAEAAPMPIGVPLEPEPQPAAPPEQLVRGYFVPDGAPLPEPEVVGGSAGPVPEALLEQASAHEWRAAEGQNIRDILAIWSEQAGVEFIWDTRNQFAVLETVNLNTSYENAVRALLNQYEQNEVRPAGSLHVDPQSGDKTLVVQNGA